MDISDIATIRLANQQLIKTKYKTPYDLISWMGAIQAQDISMAKWAIGVRLPGITDNQIEQDLNNGEFVRIHTLRPTWHFVTRADVHWMRTLSTPRIKQLIRPRDISLAIGDDVIKQTNSIIRNTLRDGPISRKEIGDALTQYKIRFENKRLNQIILHAELDGVIYNGYSSAIKQPIYCSLENLLPPNFRFNENEALQMLASRYFESHGPATLQDFQWWSGLSSTDARKAISYIKHDFIFEVIDDKTYIFKESSIDYKMDKETIHYLPAYDELLISYKDKKAILTDEYYKRVIVSSYSFNPFIISNGKAVGVWRKVTNRSGKLFIESNLFESLSTKQSKLQKDAFSIMTSFFK